VFNCIWHIIVFALKDNWGNYCIRVSSPYWRLNSAYLCTLKIGRKDKVQWLELLLFESSGINLLEMQDKTVNNRFRMGWIYTNEGERWAALTGTKLQTILSLKKLTHVKEKKNPIFLLVMIEACQLCLNHPWSFHYFL